MGKNRQNSTPQTYTTTSNETVFTDGHSQEWMQEFNKKISGWTGGGKASPDVDLNKEELEYIRNHLEDSEDNPSVPSGFLTRAEYGYHIIPLIESGELKEGDLLPSNVTLRSYSREQNSTAEYMRSWTQPTVIYRTNGNVKHFNATRFDDTYDYETESFVFQNNLKIDKITSYDAKSYPDYNYYSQQYNKAILDELGIDPSETDVMFNQNNIVIIDVSPAD